MGFGFNLFVFPLLILFTIGLIVYSVFAKSWRPVKILGGVFVLIMLFGALSAIKAKIESPISLTKKQIIGDYRIDKNFYSGKNANWQYDHYRFTITAEDSLYFYITNKDTVIKTFKEKIKYSSGPPDLWTIETHTNYHVIKYPPTLFRGHHKFYYVFLSDIYGNMFFRKQD